MTRSNPLHHNLQARSDLASPRPSELPTMVDLIRFPLGVAFLGLLTAPISVAQGNAGNTSNLRITAAPAAIGGGVGQCPDGTTPLSDTQSGCHPPNCGNIKQLDWGVPVPELVTIPKFDPSLGTLIQVELTAKVRYAGNLCVDNTSENCCTVDVQPRVQVFVEANPALPGVSTILVDDLVSIFTPGFLLGSSDGVDDCITETGNPSIGNCMPGEDHFRTTFDEDFLSGTTVLTTQAELAPWINPQGAPLESVPFDARALGVFAGGGCVGGLELEIDGFAGVELEANYVYCPNTAPTCVAPDPALDVDENPDAANNSIDINLMDLVTDEDGCIDCSTFVISQQPLEAEMDLVPSCDSSLLGDNGDDSCTDCTDCTVTYVPRVGADFCGVDSFKFKVMDEFGLETECEVFITVNPVNEPPVCVGGPALTVPAGQTVIRSLRPYVTDPDGDPFPASGPAFDEDCGDPIDYASIVPTSDCGLMFEAVGGAQNAGLWRITAPANSCGRCTISFSACDSGTPPLCTDDDGGALCTLDVIITPQNQPPICASNPPSLPQLIAGQTSIPIDFSEFVEDPDDSDGCGAPIDLDSITPSSNCGIVFDDSGQPPGTFTMTAPAGTCGDCTVTVMACDLDGNPLCVSCPVPLDVFENEPPVCVSGPQIGPLEGGETISIDFKDYVEDPDDADGCGDPLDPSSINPSSDCGGTFDNQGKRPGVFSFTAPEGFCGTCTITFDACDTGGLCVSDSGPSCSITIEIERPNERPICVGGTDLGSVDVGGTIDIDFRTFVQDPDDVIADGCGYGIDVDSIMPSSNCGGSFARTAGMPTGWWTFTAPSDYCGPCVIELEACDLAPAPDTLCLEEPCALSIQIEDVNNPPVCITGPRQPCLDEDSSRQINLNLYVEDPDGARGCGSPLDRGTFEPTSDCGGDFAEVGTDSGIFIFTPPDDYCGPCDIEFTVEDEEGVSVTCTIPLEICPVNDPPIARDDEATTDIETPVIVDLCDNDEDPDDETDNCGCLLDCSSIEIFAGDFDCGEWEQNPDNTWTFTPFEGVVDETCCFEYRIWDRDPDTGELCDFDEATVCITISDDCPPTNLREPSSLLIFPEYDNGDGMMTVHTITNTSYGQNIRLKLNYVDGDDCSVTDRSVELTANDTFTFVTSSYIPNTDRGYGYVYAQCGQTGPAVAFNHLIGQMVVMDAYDAIAYGINAIGFKAVENPAAPVAWCGLRETDHNNNGVRDFDGLEYEPVPDKIYIPRFLGQNDDRQSDLILIALTGGTRFTTTLDFLIFNDNEEPFSGEVSFYCWDRLSLMEISDVFENSYLANYTNDDPMELFGDSTVETGWIKIDGGVANSSSTEIDDPAFYAVLVEGTGIDERAADLPFGERCQLNGALLPRSLDGTY